MPPTVLTRPTWQDRAARHEARVDAWVAEHLQRRRRGEKHPVFDFLFTYYSHRPARLRRWHPGAGVVLEDADPAHFGADYVQVDRGVSLDVAAVLRRRSDTVAWIRDLLAKTANRAPQLGCFGLHEWAMVYRQSPEQVRHNAFPLRLDPSTTATVVESHRIQCSHFDAYRFFTEPARPLNVLAPSRAAQATLEQPGCLHANMDLYKWAYKLSPIAGSDLVADCFALAREIRTLDMRASPYDLGALGFDPVRIETPEGKSEYVRRQRDFADAAATLRRRLIDCCER